MFQQGNSFTGQEFELGVFNKYFRICLIYISVLFFAFKSLRMTSSSFLLEAIPSSNKQTQCTFAQLFAVNFYKFTWYVAVNSYHILERAAKDKFNVLIQSQLWCFMNIQMLKTMENFGLAIGKPAQFLFSFTSLITCISVKQLYS